MTRSVDNRLGDLLTAIERARLADDRLRLAESQGDEIGHHYHRVVPAIIHGTIEHDLGPLEVSVRRLRAGLH